jgi:hypothetical protein
MQYTLMKEETTVSVRRDTEIIITIPWLGYSFQVANRRPAK